jgi:hypothetical protein
MSIDVEVPKPSKLHLLTGTIVLVIGYVGLILLIEWLRT